MRRQTDRVPVRRRVLDDLVGIVDLTSRVFGPRRLRRSVVQQKERREDQRAAHDSGNAQAPPPSALVPQGSTLLRGHSAPVPTHGWREVSKKLDNQTHAMQTRKPEASF